MNSSLRGNGRPLQLYSQSDESALQQSLGLRARSGRSPRLERGNESPERAEQLSFHSSVVSPFQGLTSILSYTQSFSARFARSSTPGCAVPRFQRSELMVAIYSLSLDFPVPLVGKLEQRPAHEG